MAASTVNTSRMLGGVLAVADPRRGRQRPARRRPRTEADRLGVPEAFRSLVINAVTHGGLPANAAAAAAANPIAAANLGVVACVLGSAIDASGRGLHTALTVTAVILLVAAIVAALTGDRRRELV